jgi:hypothetical protein
VAFLFWADAKLERTQTQMTQQERQGPMLRLRASQNRKEESFRRAGNLLLTARAALAAAHEI